MITTGLAYGEVKCCMRPAVRCPSKIKSIYLAIRGFTRRGEWLPGARRAKGLSGAGREESSTRAESVARWLREGRGSYEAGRSATVALLSGATSRSSKREGGNYIRGEGDFHINIKASFSCDFHFFTVLCLAVLSHSYVSK